MNEDVLSALFERTATPMLLAGDDRRYREVNDAACTLLGYGIKRLRTMRIDDLVPAELSAEIPALWQDFLRQGSQAGQIQLCTAQGETITVSFSATANIVPGLHLSVFASPGHEDPVLDAVVDEPVAPGRPVALTDRERQVLTKLALGASGADIAKELYLSPETVRTHTRRAREKLGARSRSQAIALALKSGQIDV
jgi:PAS domain S-box-containing protein